jgi:hypothetical protein
MLDDFKPETKIGKTYGDDEGLFPGRNLVRPYTMYSRFCSIATARTSYDRHMSHLNKTSVGSRVRMTARDVPHPHFLQ